MTRRKNNTKGSWLDLMYIVLVIVAAGFLFLIAGKTGKMVNDNIQASGTFGTQSKSVASSVQSKYVATTDNMFLVLVVGLSLSVIVLAALIRVHPIFIVPYLLALIFLIFVSAALSNAFQELATHSEFADIASSYTNTILILTYLPITVTIVGSILAFVMYKTWSAHAGA